MSVIVYAGSHIANGNDNSSGYTDEQYEQYERVFLNSSKCQNHSNPNYVNCLPSVIFYPFGNLKLINIKTREISSKKDFESSQMDPWMYGRECIEQLKLADVSGLTDGRDYALKNLDRLYSLFEQNGNKFTHTAYGKFNDGWVSCMDLPTVALCAHIAYQMTNNEHYKSIRDLMLKEVRRPPQESGFYLPINVNQVWLSEYSDSNTNLDNEFFVLNGYMVALQSIKMLAYSMKDERLDDLYKLAAQSYKSLSSKYWYSKNRWSYYMLNLATPVPPHYMIYETKQLDALHELEKETFYEQQLNLHRKALKNVLPVYWYQRQDQKYAILYRGIINPYTIDIYGTKIEFLDSNNNVLNTVLSAMHPSDYVHDYFMEAKIPNDAVSYRIYAVNSEGVPYKIVDTSPLLQLDNPMLTHNHQFNWKELKLEAHNGKLTDNKIMVDNTVSKTTIMLDLRDIPMSKKINEYFALEISSSVKKFIDITLYDHANVGAFRYYEPIQPGKNLILLHWPGFENIEALNGYNSMRIRIYNIEDNSPALLEIGSFWIFDDTYGLYNYMRESDFIVPGPTYKKRTY